MGTNYYWSNDAKECPTCGHDNSVTLHIGKSSSGWIFALNTHPDFGIENLEDWKSMWDDGTITDEYGQSLSCSEMLDIVINRYAAELLNWGRTCIKDPLIMNYAEPGPKNLLRHIVDGQHCIGHGDGTYDLMRGEFC